FLHARIPPCPPPPSSHDKLLTNSELPIVVVLRRRFNRTGILYRRPTLPRRPPHKKYQTGDITVYKLRGTKSLLPIASWKHTTSLRKRSADRKLSDDVEKGAATKQLLLTISGARVVRAATHHWESDSVHTLYRIRDDSYE
ncbi:hypothetical protein AX14_001356, partial [Amanita brunnescens Koide BX004]